MSDDQNTISFILPCYRNLKTNLGIFDAAVQFIELGRRSLSDEVTAQGGKDFLDNKCKQYEIFTDLASAQSSELRCAQLSILSIYQCFDIFLHDFVRETAWVNNLPAEWKLKEDQDTYFDSILRKVENDFVASVRKDIGVFRIDVLDYYRLIRNQFLHQNNDHKLDVKHGTLDFPKINQFYNRVNVPSKYDELNIHDFFLYTTVAKNVARDLCSAIRPSPEVLAILINKENASYRGEMPGERLNRKISGWIYTKFSEDEEEYITSVVSEYLKVR